MSAISDAYAASVTEKMNNWPLAISTGLDPSIGPYGTPMSLVDRINMVTFETIAKNICSYPFRMDLRDPEKVTRTYYLDTTKTNTIVLTIDTSVPNTVKKTLTGNTGYDGILFKTISWIDDIMLDAIYGIE